MSIHTILPILAAFKWPATVTAAVLVFGLSTDGTLSLVSSSASKMASPVKVREAVSMPPVRQIGTINTFLASPSSSPVPLKGATSVPSDGATSVAAPIAAKSELVPGLTEARIGSSTVNVRSGPSKATAKLAVLNAGTPIRTGEIDRGWVHIWYEGGDGWVYRTYVDTGLSPIKFKAKTTSTTASAASSKRSRQVKPQIVEVASRTAVRDNPSTRAPSIYRLRAGEVVRIVERDGSWARIETMTGEGGWIRVSRE
ncbi:MAG: SH3 domain-containing protein [Devosia sp.]